MGRIASCQAIPIRLPMRRAFGTWRGPVGDAATGRVLILVRLEDEHGRVGWGEAGPIPTWSPETAVSVHSTIMTLLGPAIVGRDPRDLAGLHEALDAALAPGRGRGMPLAKAAIDLACWDLVGRATGQPLWALLGRRGLDSIRLSWSLGEGDVGAEVAAAAEAGYGHFNVKVGGGRPLDASAERIRTLRRLCPPAFICVDANGGFPPHLGRWAAAAFAAAGADVFEQPLPAPALDRCRDIVQAGQLPIALDEATTAPAELAEAIRAGALDLHVVKVGRSGGLQPSRIMAELALAHGLGLLASGLTDGGIALAAAVGFAAAFGIEAPCALNGPQFLDGGILVTEPRREGDRIWAPQGPGLGVEVDEERVEACRTSLPGA